MHKLDDNIEVVWKPIPNSSQELAMTAPVHHLLYTGTRASGKSEIQLMKFRSLVGQGYGSFLRGVIFDRAYKNLDDLISKSKRLYNKFDDDAAFHAGAMNLLWRWPTGEELLFRTLKDDKDYWNFHGQEFCVSVDTTVYTPNGEVVIGNIKQGDYILTPCGYNRVNRVFPRQYKECVSVDVYDASGRYTGRQHQSLTHRLLAYDSGTTVQLLDQYHTLKQYPSIDASYALNSQYPLSVGQENSVLSGLVASACSNSIYAMHYTQLLYLYRKLVLGHQQTYQQFLLEVLHFCVVPKIQDVDGYALLNVENYSVMLHRLHLTVQQPLLDHSLPFLGQESLRSQLNDTMLLTAMLYCNDPLFCEQLQDCNLNLIVSWKGQQHIHELVQQVLYCISKNVLHSYDTLYSRTVPSFLKNYYSYYDQYGVQPPVDTEIVQDIVHIPHDVLNTYREQLQKDALVDEDRCIRQFADIFQHPYTDKLQRSDVALGRGQAVIKPCGRLLTVDIEVDSTNCYVTSSGLVQSNCFIGFNEISKYPTSELYDAIQSCNRSSYVPEVHGWVGGTYSKEKKIPLGPNGEIPKPIPLMMLSTTNPFGPGACWLKRRFIDVAPYGKIIKKVTTVYNPRTEQEEETAVLQTAVFGHWRENPYLDAKYISELVSIDDPVKQAAWASGSWDVQAGGAFGDIWETRLHVVPRFKVPKSYYVDRCFDWGSTAPFSVVWFAEASGEEARLPDGTVFCPPAGTLIQIAEWYGTKEIGTNKGLKLSAGEIAEGIVVREDQLIKEGWVSGIIHAGPADNQIRDQRESDVDTIEKKMQDKGVFFESSNKSPGSRVNGFEIARERLLAAKKKEGPALYFMDNCVASISILPSLARDEIRVDDVSSEGEDHLWDSIRYRCLKGANRLVESINFKRAH